MWIDSYFGTFWENQYFITVGVDPAGILAIVLSNPQFPISNITVDLQTTDGSALAYAAFLAGASLDNDVFTSYHEGDGDWNRDCWSTWWDLSGVGWSNRTSARPPNPSISRVARSAVGSGNRVASSPSNQPRNPAWIWRTWCSTSP